MGASSGEENARLNLESAATAKQKGWNEIPHIFMGEKGASAFTQSNEKGRLGLLLILISS